MTARLYAIYVEDYVISTSSGVIGADIKYQEPFKGSDEEIILSNDNLEFKFSENTSKNLSICNSNIIVLKAETDQSWCNVDIDYFSENGETVLQMLLILYWNIVQFV